MQACTTTSPNGTSVGMDPRIVAFICGNCVRGGIAPSSRRPRPEPPVLNWPAKATEIILPCSGKLLPEHILKALEDGADLVCVVACQEGNCHHVEGCLRAARRVEFVRNLLDQIGLGSQRVMMFHLPGSARQDLAAGSGSAAPADEAEVSTQIQAILGEVAATLRTLPPSRLGKAGQLAGAAQEDEPGTPDTGDDSDE